MATPSDAATILYFKLDIQFSVLQCEVGCWLSAQHFIRGKKGTLRELKIGQRNLPKCGKISSNCLKLNIKNE